MGSNAKCENVDFRKKAEAAYSSKNPPETEGMTAEQATRVIQELQIHHIELEMQNEELCRAQEELEFSRARYLDLYDFAPVGYLSLDRRKFILDSNLAGAKLLGQDRTNLRNQSFTNFIFREDQDAFYLLIEELFESGLPQTSEIKLTSRNGDRLHARVEAAIAKEDGASVARIVVVDITEQKKAEEAMRQLNLKLEENSTRLIAANRDLENQAMQLRRLAGELTMTEQRERKRLAKVLHDGMQQYLVAAKFQAGVLKERTNDPVVKETTVEIETLLGESLDVSRNLAAELSPPILHDAGLIPALEWLARWMREKNRLMVEISTQMEPPELSEDVKTFLFEAVRELLLNVVKHGQTHSARIRLMPEGDSRMRLVVSDNGRGFDLAAAAPLTDSNAGKFGLVSIRERIGHIGGRFSIDSSLGKGTSVTLIAPLNMHEPEKRLAIDSTGKIDPSASLNERRERIRVLLADDHTVMREGLARLLMQEKDFEVVAQASDGRDACEKVAALQVDVVLMDISMPNMNGIEATRHIKKRHPHVRIVGLSLYAADEFAKDMLDAGASFYMSKAGPPSELKAAIRACMANEQRAPGPLPPGAKD